LITEHVTLSSGASDPCLPCLALRPKHAAAALGIGERKLWEITADRSSGIPHVRLGRAIVYPVRELADWLAERAAEGVRP
jgi:predicted DNA-binding transcriptional regulator AlpA